MRYLYHQAPRSLDGAIAREGLYGGGEGGLTRAGGWSFAHYGAAPVFFGLEPPRPWPEFSVWRVEADDLLLMADLPSLIDHGAYLDGDCLYWLEGEEPPQIAAYLAEGAIAIGELLIAGPGCAAAIDLTGTCAVAGPISRAERL
jgi:hypothetical protein